MLEDVWEIGVRDVAEDWEELLEVVVDLKNAKFAIRKVASANRITEVEEREFNQPVTVEQLVDFNNDGVINDGDMVSVDGSGYAAGLLFNAGDLDGTLVDLSTLGGEGDTDFLFVSGGSDTSSFRISDINDSRTGRLSLREIDDVN